VKGRSRSSGVVISTCSKYKVAIDIHVGDTNTSQSVLAALSAHEDLILEWCRERRVAIVCNSNHTGPNWWLAKWSIAQRPIRATIRSELLDWDVTHCTLRLISFYRREQLHCTP
jgi:hypothetical protein